MYKRLSRAEGLFLAIGPHSALLFAALLCLTWDAALYFFSPSSLTTSQAQFHLSLLFMQPPSNRGQIGLASAFHLCTLKFLPTTVHIQVWETLVGNRKLCTCPVSCQRESYYCQNVSIPTFIVQLQESV